MPPPAPVVPPVPVAAVPPPPVALVPPVVGPAGAAVPPAVPSADGVPVALGGGEVSLEDEDAEAVSEALADVSAELVDVVLVVEADCAEVEGNAALAAPVVGTVSGGAPDVSVLWLLLLPQAASPRAATMPRISAANVAIERLMGLQRTR